MAYALRAPNRKWLASALAVVVVAFLAYSLPPYVTGGTRVPATFGLHYPLLVAHVMFASVAMVTAVAQIWPGLRARRPALGTGGIGGSTFTPRSPPRSAPW